MKSNEALQTFKRLEKELQLKALEVRKQFPQKSLKWVENLLHFRKLWGQRSVEIVDLLFRAKPYPSYIEIETTTRCPLKCSFCVPENTLILGSEPKFIQDFQSGEFVFGKEGSEVMILEVKNRLINGSLIEIKANGILPVLVTPEHRLLVAKKIWQGTPREERKFRYEIYGFKSAESLSNNFALVFPKLRENKEWKEPFKCSDELMEFLGLFLAEGWVNTNPRFSKGKKVGQKGIISLTFGKHERELIDRTKNLIRELFGKYLNEKELRTTVQLQFYSVKLANWLSKFGQGANRKKLPEFIMGLNKKEKIHNFLLGFMKGDGFVNERYVQLTTSSLGLALQLQKLLSRIDVFGRLYMTRRKGTSTIEGREVYIQDLFNIRVSGADYDFFLKRKKKKEIKKIYYGEDKDNFYLSVRGTERKGYKGRVYNFETSDRTFEVNNIVIHNCEHTYWKEPNKDMSFEDFKHIVDQFPDLKWIGLTGIGEGFIRPKEFLKMIEYVKEKNVYVELYDSFLFITEDIAKKLIEFGVDTIFASIDAATKKTYDKVRSGSDYDRVWENVQRFNQLANKEEGHYPELCFHYIVNRDNIHEVVPYLEKIKELGIKPFEIRFARMLHRFDEIKDLFMEVPLDVQAKIKQRARELNLPVSWNANLPHRKPPSFNCIEWYMPFFFWNGDVINCCAQNEGNRRDWQHSVAMGNIFKTSFKEIWENRYPEFIDGLRNGDYPEECLDCPIYEF